MDSRLSEFLEIASSVRDSARRGDWSGAGQSAERLAAREIPANSPELAEYLRSLRETLIIARSSRACLLAALGRVRAAARFKNAKILPI